jgi:uncharacterized protein (DUF427 family)
MSRRVTPRPGQESVWDYPRPPRLEDSTKQIQVVFNNGTIAETCRSKRVLETSHPPVYYIPPEDVKMEYLRPAPRTSWCKWKGWAGYYSQAGDFYGGWITSDIVGPFKGEPGTEGW